MNNSDDVAQSIIPSAGFIDQPKKPQENKTNNKTIIIIFAVILSVVVIVAAIVAIIAANQKAPTENQEQTRQNTQEEPDDWTPNSAPESIREPGLLKTLTAKANQILSYGIFAQDSSLLSINVPIYFTDGTVSKHYNSLSSANKMTMIVAFYQNKHDPKLSDKQTSALSSKSCRLLFKEDDCRLIKNNINPQKYNVILHSKQKLDQEYAKLFGKIDTELPDRIIETCPFFTYVEELSTYAYRNACGKSQYKINYYYQYRYEQQDDKAYVYFAAGSSIPNKDGKYSTLYSDMDAEKILYTDGDYEEYTISKDNYTIFSQYRLVFKKENKNSDNYIYEKLEKVN